MSDRSYIVTLVVPASTEEWAEDVLIDAGFRPDEISRTDYELSIDRKAGGNVDAINHARLFLSEVEDAFREGNIDIDSLTLEVGRRD